MVKHGTESGAQWTYCGRVIKDHMQKGYRELAVADDHKEITCVNCLRRLNLWKKYGWGG